MKIDIYIRFRQEIMWTIRWSRFTECLGKRFRLILLLLPCLVIFTLYFISGRYIEFDNVFPYRLSSPEDEIVDGYLVWNPKCHIQSENPMDKSIRKFIKKKKFEACSTAALLSVIKKESNGTYSLEINSHAAINYPRFVCCWSTIARAEPKKPPVGDFDSKFNVGHCQDFERHVTLPQDTEIVMVTCRSKGKKGKKSHILYENIHAIVNPLKVSNISESYDNGIQHDRKPSVLILGIDSVSRLNFLRSLPKTEKYLRENNWYNLRGYNKMGDNTFPNVMAILTGHNITTAYADCKPKQAFGLDQCPFIWHNFKKAGYVTAYGEDFTPINTFNYLKVGFVDPPTDYYLRPYMLATEKLLPIRYKFDSKYCTGPKMAVDRIFEYAVDYAKTFLNIPYFGFFWTNSVTHNDVNGISSLDTYLLNMFDELEEQGTLNDTMIIFLSDHGMRWGEIRNTFIGWYEERLPFIYLHVPDWFNHSIEVAQGLKMNEHRLTSPFDIYETLRDLVTKSGGEAYPSSGCPSCQSLFQPVPVDRGCLQAGVSSHWCTCTLFREEDSKSKLALQGVNTFLNYVESVVREYKNEKGKRLCAKLRLKKIHRVNRILDLTNNTDDNVGSKLFYLIETTPGGGMFETTVHFDHDGTSKMTEEEVSRINSYAKESKCLETGNKKYCHCIN